MDTSTERLRIRDLVESDLEWLISLWTDADIRRGMGDFGPTTAIEVETWLDDVVTENAAGPRTSHNCAIVEAASGTPIGWIGFGPPTTPLGDYDFGYAVLPAFQGRGLGTEALMATIEYCFRTLGAESFFGVTDRSNLGSVRAMEKAGMRQIGVTDEGDPILRIENSAITDRMATS